MQILVSWCVFWRGFGNCFSVGKSGCSPMGKRTKLAQRVEGPFDAIPRCISGRRNIPTPPPKDDAAANPIATPWPMVRFNAPVQHAKTPAVAYGIQMRRERRLLPTPTPANRFSSNAACIDRKYTTEPRISPLRHTMCGWSRAISTAASPKSVTPLNKT